MSASAGLAGPNWFAHGESRFLYLPQRLCVYAAFALLACVLWRSGEFNRPAIEYVTLAFVLIAMWHGAYDHVLAKQLMEPRLGRSWLIWFGVGYVGLAASVYLFWTFAPAAALILFLFYSAWHFGTEPEGWKLSAVRAVPALALGFLPIVAAARWHGSEVVPIFGVMLGGSPNAIWQAGRINEALAIACWPVIVLAAVSALMGAFGRPLMHRAEVCCSALVTAGLFAFGPPLISFGIYFCVWHTPEHLLSTSGRSLKQLGKAPRILRRQIVSNLRAGLVPWLLSLALVAVVAEVGQHQLLAYSAELFVVLSALTVPHMVVQEVGRYNAESEMSRS